MRILIIDDQLDNANHLKMALEVWGFEVQIAANGELGVRLAGQFLPSLVLCHMALPDMDGYAVARTLRRQSALIQTRFVAVTATDAKPDIAVLQAAGFETSLSDTFLRQMTDAFRADNYENGRITHMMGSPGQINDDSKMANRKRMGPSILFVEPQATSRATLQWVLEKEGYHVITAENGLSALKLFIQTAPHIVLQNLLLPDIDGCGLAHWLRLLPGGNSVPILGISNKPTLLNHARSNNAGFDGYLSRPCLPSHVLQTIFGMLTTRGLADHYPPHLWRIRTASNIASPTLIECHRGPSASILVVSSNNFQCQKLVGYLVALGFHVSLARDGEEALIQAQRRRPDIVIIEPIVPALDGFEFCYEMKKNKDLESIAVILSTSGVVTEVDAQLAQELGAAGYVSCTPHFRDLDQLLMTSLMRKSSNPVST